MNLSQAKLLFDSIRLEGDEKNNTKYPDYEIETSVMNDIISKLNDINFTKTFQTGKGALLC